MLPEAREIARRRKSLGMRQGELARLAGVSQSFIAKLELGKISPSYSRMKRILEALESKETEEKPCASQIMKKNVICASPNDTLKKVIAKMRRHSISQLPVCESLAIIGAITENSIVNSMSNSRKSISQLLAKDVMEDSFPQISEKTPLPSILELLKHNAAVLVMKKGKVMGIISKSDIIKI